MINVNVIQRKLIKPSSPTPQHLKKFNISYIDEISPSMNVGVLLFYSSTPKQTNLHSHLQDSLSQILSQFYPLAGRFINKHLFVDCSDEGAEYVEAEAPETELIDVEKTTTWQLDDLLPRQSNQLGEAKTYPLLSIQITEFKCGGVSIGISISHRIFDASSIGTFIAAWSNASKQEGKTVIIPTFELPSLLPCKNSIIEESSEPPLSQPNKIIVKRFSFKKEAIIALKSKYLEAGDVVSRVRMVCAVIAKALIGVDATKHGKRRACIANQAVNIRGRTIPPLSNHSCGNLVVQSLSQCIEATETIRDLACVLGDATKKTIEECGEMLREVENGRHIVMDPWDKLFEKSESGEVNVMWFSDWSKFGFYEADFGFGKPVWTGIGSLAGENLAVLMDSRDGDGIEAWLHLSHKDMAYFEADELIKLFAYSDIDNGTNAFE